MTLTFTLIVVGWLAAFATIDAIQHQWGYALFNAGFAAVGAFCAWREA